MRSHTVTLINNIYSKKIVMITNREDLIQIGFKELPHFTVMNSLVYDLGRGRHLSLGYLGTHNEMLYIVQSDEINNPKRVTGCVVLSNYCYDGYLTIEKLLKIINSIKHN